MVTVEMVAKMAGVSRGTVDRVLHHRGEVRSETAERVRQVMRELDWLEDYDPLDPEHSLYVRVEREVLVTESESTSRRWAWIYHLNPRRRDSFSETDLVVDGDWLRHCAEAGRERA